MKNTILLLGNAELGIYAFRRELISALIENGFKVVVGFPFSKNAKQIGALGCKIEDTPINRHGTNILEDIKLVARYIELIKKHHPKVVLTYTIKPNVYGSLACQFANTVYMNNITGLGNALEGRTWVAQFVLFLQKIAYRKSACVFFQNESNFTFIKQKGVVNKNTATRLLPGSGVNLKVHRYEPFPESNTNMRFITVGRLQWAKGYGILFEVAKKLKARYSNVEFHIVGPFEDDDLREVIQRLIRESVVIYHGSLQQEEVHHLIDTCNCLVHPSYHEGMSNVCLEAAATGRPIIASNIPGCRETFDEGISGYGFKVGDADALYVVLEKFIHTSIEKQSEMGRQGRLKMEKEFDRQIVVDAYLEEIHKINYEEGVLNV